MTKLEYLVKNLYLLRPSIKSEKYQEIITRLIDDVVSEYFECLINNRSVVSPIILNIKELVYFNLIINFLELSDQEKEIIIKTYAFIINKAAEIINGGLFHLGGENLTDQINNYISYTQFLETKYWGTLTDRIEKLKFIHHKNMISIAYRILNGIIIGRFSNHKLFKLVEKIIDIFGFLNNDRLLNISYEDILHPNNFHSTRFDSQYFLIIFILVEYINNGVEVASDYLKMYLTTEESFLNKEFFLRSINEDISNKTDIQKNLVNDITSLVNSEKKGIKKRIEEFKIFIKNEMENAKKETNIAIYSMPLDETKLSSFKEDIKTSLHFKDLEWTNSIKGIPSKESFTIDIPKRVFIKDNRTIYISGYEYGYLNIESILQKEIRKKDINAEFLDTIKGIDKEYNFLLIPKEYFIKIISDLKNRTLPEAEILFFKSIWIEDGLFNYRWIDNNGGKIYAIKNLNEGFAIKYDSFSFTHSINNDNNGEPTININVALTYVFDGDLKIKTYVLN